MCGLGEWRGCGLGEWGEGGRLVVSEFFDKESNFFVRGWGGGGGGGGAYFSTS